eukprot:gene4891-34657_t
MLGRVIRESLRAAAAVRHPNRFATTRCRSSNGHSTAAQVTDTMLEAKEDHYGGVIVDSESLPHSTSDFETALATSLGEWRGQGKRGIWLKIPTSLAAHIAPATSMGFDFHHADPGHVMMTAWLPDTPNTLPPNASHQVGVGAFILNEKREVLVVQEKNGPLKEKQVWKMPTGLVHAGERQKVHKSSAHIARVHKQAKGEKAQGSY